MTAKVVSKPEDLGAMGILEHLDELRKRLTAAIIGWVITTFFSIIFTESILKFISRPYCTHLTMEADPNCESNQLIVLSPTENIEIFFGLALTTGAMLAMPWFLYQAWKFIEPGLRKSEKKYVYVFIPAATLLFVAGATFSYFVLLPAAISFLANFLSGSIESNWQLAPYIEFVRDFVFWLGVSFEMPLVFYFLGRFGIVSSSALRKQWRFAIVGIAILAAIITPSIDPITMLLTMAPLTVLYLFSILLSRIGYRQFERIGETREDREDEESE